MRSTVGRLARLSAIYALGDILTRGAAFLLLPIYMRYLSPAEYGIIGIAEMLKQILIVLLSFGLTGAVNRFYYQAADDGERRRYFGAMWAFLIVAGGAVALALDRAGGAAFGSLFRQTPFDPYIRITIWTAFLQAAFVYLPPHLLRARERALAYTAYNLLLFGLTTLAIIGFVIWSGRGAAGYVQAQLLAAAVMAVGSTIWLLRTTTPNFQAAYLRPLLLFSLPLLPHFAAHWALNFSDRAILERYVSLDQLGIYTLAYQFGIVLQLIVGAGNSALLPMFGRAASAAADRDSLPRVVTYYLLATALVVLGMASGADSLVRLVTPQSYHPAGQLAIWIIISYMLVGMYYVPMNALAQTAGRTRFVPLLTLIAALCNILLNLIFVPRFGVIAAVVGTMAGFLVLLILVFIAAQRRSPLRYEYWRIAKIVLALGLSLAAGAFGLRWSPMVNLLLVPALMIVMLLMLSLLGFWNEAERLYLLALRRSLALRWRERRSL